MNAIKAIKLFGLYEKLQAVLKEKVPMTKKLPQVLTLLVSLGATIGLPAMITDFVHAHQVVYVSLVAAAIVLHALMPSLFSAPGDADLKATKLGVALLCAILLSVGGQAQAQTAPNLDIQNIYAAGVSYSAGGSPAVAGTGLYAHLINGSGTYAFTVVDALPATVKPFTVTTNIGVGVAQKVATFGKIPIYMPAATGISWTGSNTGWQWNTGALATIHVKGQYYVMPSVRVLKSSVSGGSGYQPVLGVLFAWGQ